LELQALMSDRLRELVGKTPPRWRIDKHEREVVCDDGVVANFQADEDAAVIVALRNLAVPLLDVVEAGEELCKDFRAGRGFKDSAHALDAALAALNTKLAEERLGDE
jgi:hypothetical protein